MLQKKRLHTPDMLKGFALLFMIQVHILELFAQQNIYDGIVGKISLSLGSVPAAPVFMMVMGYFVAFNQKSEWAMVKRGVNLFIVGMLLNVGLNLHLAYNVFFEGWDEFVDIFHYWFGADILQLAGLSLVAMGLLSFIFKTNWIPWTILVIIVASLGNLIDPYSGDDQVFQYIMAFIYGSAEWSYFPLIPWLAYPLAGFVFRLIEIKYGEVIYNLKWLTITGIILLSLIIFTGSFAIGIMTDLQEYYHHGFLFFSWAIGFSAVWAITCKLIEYLKLENGVTNYIRWLGENVTLIYIIQWLIIGNIATAIYKTQSMVQSIAWFVAVLGFTSILTWIIRRRYAAIKI